MHRVHGIAELVERVSEMTAWVRADEGFPKVLSKAYTDDGERCMRTKSGWVGEQACKQSYTRAL